jgi:integrase
MKLKLTKAFVGSVKSTDKDQIVWDTEVPGLHLKVTSAGRKVFLYYHRDTMGQQKRPALGQVGLISLEKARELARKTWYESRYVLATPTTIQTALVKSVQSKPKPAWVSLSELCERYVEGQVRQKSEECGTMTSYATARRALVTGDKLDAIRNKNCGDIDQVVLVEQYERWRTLNGPAAANQMLDYLRAAWNWGAKPQRRLCPKGNPTEGIDRAARTKRRTVLKPGEYARVMKAMGSLDSGKNRTAMGVIKIELFTGLRTIEGRTLEWSRIDPEHLEFTFRAKGGEMQTKPLTKQALAVLRQYGSNPDTDKHVFPGERAECISYNRVRDLWDLIRREARCPHVNLHDLRRSFLTYGEGEGIMTVEQAAEAAGHSNSNTTKLHYLHSLMSQRLRREQAVADVVATKNSSSMK